MKPMHNSASDCACETMRLGGDNLLSVSAGCQQARAVFSHQSVGSR
jgi:hypothetical protein